MMLDAEIFFRIAVVPQWLMKMSSCGGKESCSIDHVTHDRTTLWY